MVMFTAATFALLLSSAAAFAPQRARTTSASRLSMVNPDQDKSIALPWSERPKNLDGSFLGDVGFDPFGYTEDDFPQQTFLVGGKAISNLRWYREAEIAHGRVAMLAALGYIFPNIAHFPGNEQLGADVFANMNPLEAIKTVPAVGLLQILVTIGFIERFHIKCLLDGADDVPGDIGLGQGAGRWNPFGFDFSPEEYEEKQLQELKNGRLAMVGITGFILQNAVTKEGIWQQLSGSFSIPDYEATAGSGLDKFFPAGV